VSVYPCLNMDDRTRTRKNRLQQLIDGRPYFGNQSAFAEKAGLTKGRITQLLDPNDSFGERSARKLAGALGLAEDFFDGNQEPAGEPASEVARLGEALAVLSAALRNVDKSTRIAVAPLLAAMATDPSEAKNQSELVLRLLVTDRDKVHEPAQDRMRQPHISVNLGVLDLGDANGRSDTDRAAGGRKK